MEKGTQKAIAAFFGVVLSFIPLAIGGGYGLIIVGVSLLSWGILG